MALILITFIIRLESKVFESPAAKCLSQSPDCATY